MLWSKITLLDASKDIYIYEDEALFCSVERSVDSWVMDYGASFHATHIMKNLKEGNFGKVRLGNGEILEVTEV